VRAISSLPDCYQSIPEEADDAAPAAFAGAVLDYRSVFFGTDRAAHDELFSALAKSVK